MNNGTLCLTRSTGRRCRQMVLEGSAFVPRLWRAVPVLHADETGSGKHAAGKGPGLHPAAHGTAGGRHCETRSAVDQALRAEAARVGVAELHLPSRTARGKPVSWSSGCFSVTYQHLLSVYCHCLLFDRHFKMFRFLSWSLIFYYHVVFWSVYFVSLVLITLEWCNPWPLVANRHISISQILSLWRHSHYDVSRLRRSQFPFSLWRHSHCDVFATELATPTVTDIRYGHLTAFNI